MRSAAQFYHLVARLLVATKDPPDDIETLLDRLGTLVDVLPEHWLDSGLDKTADLNWGILRAMMNTVASRPDWVETTRSVRPENVFGSSKKRPAFRTLDETGARDDDMWDLGRRKGRGPPGGERS